MPETVILSAMGVSKGATTKGKQSFTIIANDFDNNVYYVSFVCEQNFSEGVEKALRRLVPVKVKETPATETKEEVKGE